MALDGMDHDKGPFSLGRQVRLSGSEDPLLSVFLLVVSTFFKCFHMIALVTCLDDR